MTAAMTAMLTTKANRPVRTIESQGTRDFSAISFDSNVSANTYAFCARQDQEAFCTRLRRGSSLTVRKGSSTLGSETLTIQESEHAQVGNALAVTSIRGSESLPISSGDIPDAPRSPP